MKEEFNKSVAEASLEEADSYVRAIKNGDIFLNNPAKTQVNLGMKIYNEMIPKYLVARGWIDRRFLDFTGFEDPLTGKTYYSSIAFEIEFNRDFFHNQREIKASGESERAMSPTKTVDSYGIITYKLNGELHREDGPAKEWPDGSKEWYLNGELHREDGPAKEYTNGEKYWYGNGKLHREHGPAVEYANGTKAWYLNGERHREDGPAREYADGDKEWYLNGKLHREGGPAVERSHGDKFWYRNGELHREDGPALEWASGFKEWYFNNKQIDPLHFRGNSS